MDFADRGLIEASSRFYYLIVRQSPRDNLRKLLIHGRSGRQSPRSGRQGPRPGMWAIQTDEDTGTGLVARDSEAPVPLANWSTRGKSAESTPGGTHRVVWSMAVREGSGPGASPRPHRLFRSLEFLPIVPVFSSSSDASTTGSEICHAGLMPFLRLNVCDHTP